MNYRCLFSGDDRVETDLFAYQLAEIRLITKWIAVMLNGCFVVYRWIYSLNTGCVQATPPPSGLYTTIRAMP